MPTTIDSAGITFNDATSFTSAVLAANSVGATQIANGSVTAAKLGTNEQKQIAKAWVNFDGTTSPGTIRSSYNVSSVTRIANGNYTVNFPAGVLADDNYSVCATAGGTAIVGVISDPSPAQTVSSTTIFTFNSSNAGTNASIVGLQVFGN
jgi:hypothetical protein